MRKIKAFELVVELYEQIDESLDEVYSFIVLDKGLSGIVEVHKLDCDADDCSSLRAGLLLLLDGEDLEGLEHSQQPVLAFMAFPFFFEEQ